MRSTICHTLLGLGLVLGVACNKDKASADPQAGSNLLGGVGDGGEGGEDDLGDLGDEEGDELGGEDGGEVVKAEPFPELPKPSKPVEKCKGKGKNRACKLVDPKPGVSAAYGARSMLGDYRWGMTPKQVFSILSQDVEKEYAQRQKDAKDAMAQDTNRQWREEQIQALKANHVKFQKASKHRWGVSLIQYEYEDDNGEEMLWINANNTLRKYYFFKDGELWKILYAYSTEAFPGKSYVEVVDEKFKKWFGPSPNEKVKQDEKTKQPILRYNEWKSVDGDIVRSFDMTSVHGIMALAVVDGDAESRIGERLPNTKRDEGYSDAVKDVLGGSDVCYDKSGEIVECAEGSGGGL